jgi:preprotein translocase subunit SecF
LAGRLYRGETNFDLVGRRKMWFAISGVLIVICLASIIVRGFHYGIEFKGGNTYQIPASGVSLSQFSDAVAKTGTEVVTAQRAGAGSQATYIVKTPELSAAKSQQVKNDIAKDLKISESAITDSHVSSSWGSDVSRKALQGLIVFLIAVALYIGFRFEFKMAIAAMLALLHDLLLSAGIYSLVGFEVTPSTVVGLLTILGFSLYDTVVVFDKVAENTKGILAGSRQTYSDAANLAVNQTFMRSINTSLIALLPVAGLLFVGAGLLGVGTLKDLALVLFVGLATGAYSSLFLATPILAALKEREAPYAALRQRVTARRGAGDTTTRRAAAVPKDVQPVDADPVDTDDDDGDRVEEVATASTGARRPASPAAPRPGSRPAGARSTPPRRKGSRPSGKKKRR